MRTALKWTALACAAVICAALAADSWFAPPAATAAVPSAAPVLAARGWPMRQDGPYLIIETPHYIFRTEHSAEIGQIMASQQEALFQELYRRLSSVRVGVQQIPRLEVVTFKTQARYLEVMGQDGKGTQGLYNPAKNMITGWMPAEDFDLMLETLRHECTHQFVEQFIGPKCPLWLNEGLAEYFEKSGFKGGQLIPGQVPATTLSALKRSVESGKLILLSRMLNMSNQDWQAAVKAGSSQASMQYNEAWSMVHFLQGADKGKYATPFLQYIQLIARNTPVSDAWNKTFGAGSVPAFEKRWLEYINELKPTGGLGCRRNLEVLGFLIAKSKGRQWTDIDELYQAAAEGKAGSWVLSLGDGAKIDGTDKEVMKSVFRCPEDASTDDKPSYELFTASDGDPPCVGCRHHVGYVMATTYTKNDKGGLKVSVVMRPTPPATTSKTAGK